MSNLKTILKSFNFKEELNPKFWIKKDSTYILRPQIREKLLQIAYEFLDSLDVDVIISDVTFTGSLSNFNWSEYSDVDLHLKTDYNQFQKEDVPLYEELFDLKSSIFSQNHDITIYGYDVELYVEDENQKRTENAGVYSILNNQWVVEPTKEKKTVDKTSVIKKSKSWIKEIDNAIEIAKEESLDDAKKIIKRIRTKIAKYRTCGLQKGGEFSVENLVFKVLRRGGYIQKIKNLKNELIDKNLSLKEATLGSPIDIKLKVNSPFGAKRKYENHPGVDLAAPSGTELKSPADGEVIEARDRGTSCGGTLYIKHPNGFKTRYCHIKRFDVSAGEKVTQGQVVGLTGGDKNDPGRGNSFGAHLHFEVYKDGALVDPMVYIDDLGTIKSDKNVPQSKKSYEIEKLIELGEKSTFLFNLFKLVFLNKEFKNLKSEGKIPYDVDVEYLQTALQLTGSLLPKYGVDGLFGPETEAAVKDFQKSVELPETGVIKSNDLKYLYAKLIKQKFEDSDLLSVRRKPEVDTYAKKKNTSFDIANGKIKIKGNFTSEQVENINIMIDKLEEEGITNPYAQIGVLSVIGKETNFIPKNEACHESTPNSRIRKLFGNRLTQYDDKELSELKKDCEKFFDVVYGKDSGINWKTGNTKPGDGYKYRGRGFNQITFKHGYEKIGNLIGMDLVSNPDILNDVNVAAKAAVKFFTVNTKGNIPNFDNKEDAIEYFTKINAGGVSDSENLDTAMNVGKRFDVLV